MFDLFTVVEPNRERREQIAALLAPFADQVKVTSGIAPLVSNWPDRGLLVIADKGSLRDHIQEAIRDAFSCWPHILYGQNPSLAAVVDAVAGGAIDYVGWPLDEKEVRSRIELWAAKAAKVRRRQKAVMQARTSLARLSPRELQTLKLIADGLSSAEIGRELEISIRTVDIHRGRIRRKLLVSNPVAAARVLLESDG
jgi:FixJ family two-component response regulator